MVLWQLTNLWFSFNCNRYNGQILFLFLSHLVWYHYQHVQCFHAFFFPPWLYRGCDPNSHGQHSQKGWEKRKEAVISYISVSRSRGPQLQHFLCYCYSEQFCSISIIVRLWQKIYIARDNGLGLLFAILQKTFEVSSVSLWCPCLTMVINIKIRVQVVWCHRKYPGRKLFFLFIFFSLPVMLVLFPDYDAFYV